LDPGNELDEEIRVVTIEAIEGLSKLKDHFMILDIEGTITWIGNANRDWEFRSIKNHWGERAKHTSHWAHLLILVVISYGVV
jgi:hypothetical protein